MSDSRNNHYVPQWYQEGFFEPGARELACLDLDPPRRELADGRTIIFNNRYRRATSGLFVERDLYSTFGLGEVNVEIERFLFGAIDTSGARAVRALIGADVNEWIRHFHTLFEFLDIQKLRTPKGLDWLRSQYPITSQNELMREMQGLRMMHCSIWSEGVKEIVSAENSEVKFITSDHPVTIYNRGLPPASPRCTYPNDPSIALKGSQTLFPLNRDFCLILTNLEYARDASTDPLVKRTFARNFRQTMVRADAFIRERKLAAEQVSQINSVIMGRARKFLAAGLQNWLSPDPVSGAEWRAAADTLAPPKDALWQFGGEMLAKLKDGTTYFQDEFGRREPEHQAMLRVDHPKPKRGEVCGCGSQRRYRDCCETIPLPLRRSWTELSIRERNLALRRAVVDIFGIAPDRSWEDVRRDVTDKKIAKFYSAYASLWPIETDLLSLLPKPDGRPRAVYTGVLHPKAIADVALSAGLYFGELLIQNPLPHARMVNPEFSPTANPQAYRGEVLKAIIFLLDIMPLVEIGLVNLVPDPSEFDSHLRQQMIEMARERNEGRNITPKKSDPGFKLMQEDSRRNMLLVTPHDTMVRFAKKAAEVRGEAPPGPRKTPRGFRRNKASRSASGSSG